jgi:hypothetical protein
VLASAVIFGAFGLSRIPMEPKLVKLLWFSRTITKT